MHYYKIADLVMAVDCDDSRVLTGLDEFSVKEIEDPDLNLSIKFVPYIDWPEGHIIFNENFTWMSKPGNDEEYYVYLIGNASDESEQIIAMLDVSRQWRNGIITCLNDDNLIEKNEILIYYFWGALFRYSILHRECLAVHASAIKWDGKAIIFSAPSGTGKSTQSRLWQERFGYKVKILNDDAPVIRLKGTIPYVFGNPWSGSSKIYCNECAPLTAIVLLQQELTNSITRLSVKEALDKFMPRFFLPYFDSVLMNLAIKTFDQMISSVPVYLLKCRPDQEAVELVYQCVK